MSFILCRNLNTMFEGKKQSVWIKRSWLFCSHFKCVKISIFLCRRTHIWKQQQIKNEMVSLRYILNQHIEKAYKNPACFPVLGIFSLGVKPNSNHAVISNKLFLAFNRGLTWRPRPTYKDQKNSSREPKERINFHRLITNMYRWLF